MMNATPVDWSPALALLAGSGSVTLLILLGLAWRWRGASRRQRLAALTMLALFLTVDLIAFGAFTRLTDSGLGCPDWPGCYGEASPLAARDAIHAAQQALPSGPVTWSKAWVEMTHRYLAMVLGGLILTLAVASLRWRRELPHCWLWPLLTLGWVIVQGLFGRYTVTWKLYPAIVTMHLLGAQLLLALLMIQHRAYQDQALALGRGLRTAVGGVLALVLAQVALGGWVSSNYAVLACQGFPACNGQWWPQADFAQGFTLLRELGRAHHGGYLGWEALVAIHWAHRLMAAAVAMAITALAVALWRRGAVHHRCAATLGGLLALQALTGIGNVVLQWPLAGALLHSVGAAALVATLVGLLARREPRSVTVPQPAERPAWRAPQQVVLP